MKDLVLASITKKENGSYVDKFKKIASDKYPRLTMQEILELQTQKPVLGLVIHDFSDYERVLSLKRFVGLNMQKGTWLIAEHFNEKYGIGIGYTNNNLEIFREVSNKTREEYYLSYVPYPPSKTVQWLKPPQNFLQDTLALLQGEHQEKFKGLII